MQDQRVFRIGDVVARTGLTERMIRHYESLGLVAPERSAAGQRLYDADALLALAKVSLLKQAGMPLDMIEKWLANPLDARGLITAQLDYLRGKADRIARSIVLLKDIDRELEEGTPADVDHLARIIASSNNPEAENRARAFFEKHFTKADHQSWQDMQARLRLEVDAESYDAAWRDLIGEIKLAMPLDPASDEAQHFLDRWDALLAPFRKVATPEQQAMARQMWANVDEWGDHGRQPATNAVTDFIQKAYAVRAATETQTKVSNVE